MRLKRVDDRRTNMQPMRTSCLLSGWRAPSLTIVALILRHRGLIVAAMQEHSKAAESYAAAAARSNDEAVRSFMAGLCPWSG